MPPWSFSPLLRDRRGRPWLRRRQIRCSRCREVLWRWEQNPYVHLRPAGGGHTDFAPIAKALRDIGYNGFVSAEAMAGPGGPEEAAKMTMAAFQKYFA